jgi:death on curing protein
MGFETGGSWKLSSFVRRADTTTTLIHEAAALMESLANNHAFLDGNKRISFAATDTFLRINGNYLEVEPFAAHKFITESIGKREFRIRQIREWLSAHVKPL